MPAPVIQIHNPTGLAGRVATVLPGSMDMKTGLEVKLVDSRDQDLAFGEVLDVWIGALASVPALALELAHDPLQRTFSGMMLHLQSRFEEGSSLKEDSRVTVLVLRVKDSTLIRPTNRDISRLS